MDKVKSVIPYIPFVPEQWDTPQTKYCFNIKLGKMIQNDPISEWDEHVPYLKAINVNWLKVDTETNNRMWASPSQIRNFGIRTGDLLISEGGDVGRSGMVESVPEKCIIQNALHRVRSNSNSYNKFLYYYMSHIHFSGWFDILCNRATIAHLTFEKLGSLQISLPPLETQKQIAHFLDKETNRIDTLISKKQKQIELLQEKRQAIITQSVSRGLNPDVRMKDSGVEWIGEIPEHWECIKHSILLRSLEQGWSPVAENKSVDPGEWGVIKVSCISKGRFVQYENKSLIPGTEIRKKHQIQKGDMLMSRGNTVDLVGDVCLVDEIDNLLLFSDLVYRLGYQESTVDKKYIMYFHLSQIGRFQISRDASGSSMTMAKISQENIKNWTILQPPKEEQEEISLYLVFQLSRIENLKQKVFSSINLLKEYRSSLITHAVSGQIDISKKELSQ